MAEWNAGDYNQHSSLQAAMAQERLDSLVLKGMERILDIGCGDGKVTAQIAARVPRGSVLGVDPSEPMIAFARANFGPAAHPNLAFAVADVRRLALQAEFDLLVSFNALHWVADQDAALRSMRAALKPAGSIMLQFVPQGERKSVEEVIEETALSPRWIGYFPNYVRPYVHFSPEEYRTLAERNGLRVLRIVTRDKKWNFGSREAFAGFARGTFGAWALTLPQGEREAFIGDALDRYRAAVAVTADEQNTLKFCQMEVVLAPVLRGRGVGGEGAENVVMPCGPSPPHP